MSLFLVTAMLVAQLMPVQAATQGSLAGYWTFEESYGTTASDASGADNAMTLHGNLPGDPWENWTDAKSSGWAFDNNRALVLNGASYATNASSAANDMTTNSFSISSWFKADQEADNLQYLASKLTNDSNTGYAMSINTFTNASKLYLNLRLGDDEGNAVNWGYSLPSGTNNDGGWHYAAVTIDRTNDVARYYIDGIEAGTRSLAALTGSLTNDGLLTFGRQSHTNNGYLTGAMDDTRIYNRALTAGEVADLADQKYTTATWSGDSSVNFYDAGNWDVGGVPDAFTHVIVPSDAIQGLVLDDDATIQSLTVESGVTVAIGDNELNIDNGGVDNSGTITLDSGDIYSDSSWTNNGEFTNEDGGVWIDGGLTIGDEASFDAGDGNVWLDGSMHIESGGLLEAGSAHISVEDDWNNEGDFDAGTSTVDLDNDWWSTSVYGDNTFYNLTSNTDGATIYFEAGKTQTILNHIDMSGYNDFGGIDYLQLRSTSSSSQWIIDVQGTYDFTYIDVEDSNNISAEILVPQYSYDSGNNLRWNIVGPAVSIDWGPYEWGDWSNDTTPTLPFHITSVANANYRIQIDDDSDFDTPVIDYTSDFAPEGGRSFTVGQAEGDGNYAVGDDETTLSSNTYYYWRVLATDEDELESEWEDGSFGVDTANPDTPQADLSGGYYQSGTVIYLDSGDTGGSGLEDIYYTTNGATPNGGSTWYDDSEGITINSTTTIKAIAYDYAGNASGVMTETYTIDNEAPDTPEADVSGGTYDAVQAVELTSSDGGGSDLENIYYTTDGSTPDNSSTECQRR